MTEVFHGQLKGLSAEAASPPHRAASSQSGAKEGKRARFRDCRRRRAELDFGNVEAAQRRISAGKGRAGKRRSGNQTIEHECQWQRGIVGCASSAYRPR